MRERLAGMSPHLGVKKGATGYARGAALMKVEQFKVNQTVFQFALFNLHFTLRG